MREGMRKAGAKMLEPIMKVEVVTPEDYTGGIIGDLTSRRGQVTAKSPAATPSRSLIRAAGQYVRLYQHIAVDVFGRAQFSMQFDHYDPVPQNISEEIQAKFA